VLGAATACTLLVPEPVSVTRCLGTQIAAAECRVLLVTVLIARRSGLFGSNCLIYRLWVLGLEPGRSGLAKAGAASSSF
jgi:hypothetical protein